MIRSDKLVLIFTLSIIIFSISAHASGSPPLQYQPPCSAGQVVCLYNAFNTGGNETIEVCAGTSQLLNVSNFSVWYNTTGPLNISKQGILNATWSNGTQFNFTTMLFNNETNPTPLGDGNFSYDPCVRLILNGSRAPFTNKTIPINLSANGTEAYVPGLQNNTMFTINYAVIQIVGNIPNTVFMTFNNQTKQFIANGPGATDDAGYYAQHCIGVVNNVGGNNVCVKELPLSPAPDNNYAIRGIPMCRNTQMGCTEDNINSTQAVYAFDFISSNVSVLANVTPGIPLIMSLNIPSAVSFMKVSRLKESAFGEGGPFDSNVNISSFDVLDYGTSNKVFSLQNVQGEQDRPPLFLQAGKFYDLNITLTGASTERYPIMLPYQGFTGLMVAASNSSENSIIYGKVVNESNSPIANAIVYAQFYKSGGGDGIMFINSSVSNENGVFTMRLPKTAWTSCGGNCQQPWPVYQFVIMSNQTNTSTGAPMYFQSIDTNSGMGYFAERDSVYLPKPILLKSGGRADVNVTLNGATTITSEIVKTQSLGTGTAKDATTGKMTMLSIFGGSVELPAGITIPFFSPAGSILLNLLGSANSMGGPGQASVPSKICVNTTSVYQGVITSLNCNMTAPGYLNLGICAKNDLFNSNCDYNQKRAGDYGFWFETSGIIRDAASGNIVMYLSPEGTILQNLIGFGGSQANANITLPLPAGNYTLELAPSTDWSRYLGVSDSRNITIIAGQNTTSSGVMAEAWRVNPMFNPSMTLSGNNAVEVSVEYGASGQLTNESVSVSAKVLYTNKTAVNTITSVIPYNLTTRKFVNNTFNPGALGIPTGKYYLLLNATNITGTKQFTSTMLMPMYAYDFQTGIDLGGFTFGAGRVVSGRIFAYNSSGPIPANTSAIIVQMTDSSGASVSTSANVSNIVNGMGTINISMPSNVGFYSILVKVNASNKFGMSDNWVQVSNFNIQTMTDRFNYQPTDTVSLTVKVLNSSSNTALNASVEVSMDGSSTPATGVTDSNGKATISLSPAIYGTNNAWSYGWHNMHIKISVLRGNDVTSVDTWTGFDVRGIEMNIRPDRPSYSQGDIVLLQMFGAGVTVSSLKVDGTGWTQITGECAANYDQRRFCVNTTNYGMNYINISSGASTGHHNVEISASTAQGSQTFYTGFDISAYNIQAVTDEFSYDQNENITLNVTITYPNNGSAVSGMAVNATLYKAQPPNDIYVGNASRVTDATGKVSLRINATQTGFNYIKINASGQLWFIGVQVSSLNITLWNAAGAPISNNQYTGVADGVTPVIINVSARTGGYAVPDGSTVSAAIWAFGQKQDLPSNTTTNGVGVISFTIPSFAPAQTYGLEIRLSTPSGEMGMAPPATLQVTGGSAMQLSVSADRSFMQPYMPNDSAIFTAVVTYSNGTPVSGRTVNFVYGSEGTKPNKAGNATVGADGVAKLRGLNVPSTDGPYYLQASIDGTDTQAYSGFLVSSLAVAVTSDANQYSPGDNMLINITVTNRTSGAVINATGGFVSIFNKGKGKREINLNVSGQQPYRANISIPNESAAVGSYPIGVVMFSGQSEGTGFALLTVINGTQQINVTTPETITANESFTVNISATSGSYAGVTVFSPAASQVVFDNSSVVLSGSPKAAIIPLTVTYPGIYVINTFIQDVGSKTTVIKVAPSNSASAPNMWTYTSNSASTTNTTSFTTSNNIYIMSNTENTTAKIMRVDSTTNSTVSASLPLKMNSSGTYYAVLNSTDLVSGSYFVRLDTDEASGVSAGMLKVT